MPAVPDRDQCKAELEAVIASGIFAKAPSLALLLEYVCTRYFEGHADQIKEYNIAVEALGRPASFDPRQDSIVRVEAFRLRKRLKQYYENEGAVRHLRIVIPSGQYVPQFVENGKSTGNGTAPDSGSDHLGDEEGVLEIAAPAQTQELAIAPAPVTAAPAGIVQPRLVTRARLAVFLVLPLMVAGLTIAVWYTRGHSPARAVGGAKAASVPLGSESEEIRILCGSSNARHVDRAGNVWSGDRFFRGGSVFTAPNRAISRASDPELFFSRRDGEFSYDIPLKPGIYELHLYFAETLFGEDNTAGGGESSRVFRVFINDRPALWLFDVIADAGGSSTADEKVFTDVSPAKDGMLHLHFAALFKETPFLNAIEIVAGIPGQMHPVRIMSGSRAYTDSRGVVWSADRYFSHGSTVARRERVSNTTDPEFFAAERFGNFTYAIPVAPGGRYTVTLKFAETWFGPGEPGGGGVGSRMFDVYCNGTALLRNFDILRAAGGAQRALEKSFHGIVPNAQGKIDLSFVPVVNYASVSAIEVVDDNQ